MLTIVCAVSLPASAFVHDPELGWGSTRGVDFSMIKYAIERYHCMRSEDYFFGCVQLINAMGSFSQPPVALMPKTTWAGAQVTVLRDYGPLVLARVEDPGDLSTGSARNSTLSNRQLSLRMASAAAFWVQRDRIKGRNDTTEMEFDLLAHELLDSRAPGVSAAYAIGYATNALIEVQDPHAGFSVKSYERSLIKDTDGTFVGIGAAVQEIPGDTRLQIYRVLEGSPAERAGLRGLDVILSLGGVNAAGLRNNQFAMIMRENAGKPLAFVVERDGLVLSTPITVTPTAISVSNPEVRLVNDLGQKVLHVRVRTFWDERVCEKVKLALVDALLPNDATRDEARLRDFALGDVAPDVRGVVLDLRDNRGGIVEQAVCVAGLFVGPRRIATEASVLGDGKSRVYDSAERRLVRRPVAVLINDMTASAAEIVAGALQDYASVDPALEHVFLVGTRSHGKGTVQRVSDSFEFPELLKSETVARYQLPFNHPIHLVGLTPDFEVFRGPQATLEDRYAVREMDFMLSPRAAAALATWTPGADRETRIKQYGKDCLRGQSESIWKQNARLDYQLLKAEELVTCRPSI